MHGVPRVILLALFPAAIGAVASSAATHGSAKGNVSATITVLSSCHVTDDGRPKCGDRDSERMASVFVPEERCWYHWYRSSDGHWFCVRESSAPGDLPEMKYSRDIEL